MCTYNVVLLCVYYNMYTCLGLCCYIFKPTSVRHFVNGYWFKNTCYKKKGCNNCKMYNFQTFFVRLYFLTRLMFFTHDINWILCCLRIHFKLSYLFVYSQFIHHKHLTFYVYFIHIICILCISAVNQFAITRINNSRPKMSSDF